MTSSLPGLAPSWQPSPCLGPSLSGPDKRRDSRFSKHKQLRKYFSISFFYSPTQKKFLPSWSAWRPFSPFWLFPFLRQGLGPPWGTETSRGRVPEGREEANFGDQKGLWYRGREWWPVHTSLNPSPQMSAVVLPKAMGCPAQRDSEARSHEGKAMGEGTAGHKLREKKKRLWLLKKRIWCWNELR